MFPILSRWLLPATLCAAALTAQAQSATPPIAANAATRPDPLDAKAGVPALTFESSFSRYRRSGDDKALSWRDANDAVARIGGWRVYAREAQEPASSAPAASAPATPTGAAKETGKPMPMPMPMPQGHSGHKSP
jgi:hypothetical protein